MDVPIQPDPDKVIVGSCDTPEGGTPTAQGPKYVLVVTNPE